jgi:hypothetical protein
MKVFMGHAHEKLGCYMKIIELHDGFSCQPYLLSRCPKAVGLERVSHNSSVDCR